MEHIHHNLNKLGEIKIVDEIILKFIGTSIGFITTGFLGYIVAQLKDYKKRDKSQDETLKCLL